MCDGLVKKSVWNLFKNILCIHLIWALLALDGFKVSFLFFFAVKKSFFALIASKILIFTNFLNDGWIEIGLQ